MNDYFENLNKTIKSYFNILSDEIPNFLYDYINTSEIQKQKGIEELGFKNKEIAERFVHTMSILYSMYIRNKTKFSMQFLADIMKKMAEKKLITINDL